MLPLKRALAPVLAVALAIGVLFATASAGTPTGKIHLVGNVTEYHLIRLDPLSKEAWYFSLSSVRTKGKKFGYGILVCSYVSVRTSVRECVGTFSLPTGKLVVAGSFLYPTLFELAVTGSTGGYSAAGGTLLARQFEKSKTTYWFDFTLK